MWEFILANWAQLLLGILGAVLVVLRVIPGEQGEALIEKIMEWLKSLTGNRVRKK